MYQSLNSPEQEKSWKCLHFFYIVFIKIGLKIGLSLTYARLVMYFYVLFKHAISPLKTRAKSVEYTIFARLCEIPKCVCAKELEYEIHKKSQYDNRSDI